MKHKIGLLAIAAAALLFASPSFADVTNAGFENGTSGWTSYGVTGSASSVTGSQGTTYTSQFGSNFGYVTAANENVYSTLSQTFSLVAGQVVSGYVGFLAEDYLPFNDKAILTISDGETLTSLFTSNVQTVGDYGSTGWVAFSYTALVDGLYTLNLGVKNVGDSILGSQAFLDMPQASVAVPGPEAGAGLGALALGGMALYMKRRRKEEATAA